MQVTFTHGSFNTTISTDLHILEKKIEQFEKKFGKVTSKYGKKYAIQPIIKYIQKLMREGGSSERRFSWGYWERSGGGDFKYRKAKSGWFTNGFTSKRKVQRFPIHPRFYFLRKVRKRPKSGEFALIDTSTMIKSFMLLNAFTMGNETQLTLGNIDKKFDIHEIGIKVPQRPMLAPAVVWFENNKALKEEMMNMILKEFEKI